MPSAIRAAVRTKRRSACGVERYRQRRIRGARGAIKCTHKFLWVWRRHLVVWCQTGVIGQRPTVWQVERTAGLACLRFIRLLYSVQRSRLNGDEVQPQAAGKNAVQAGRVAGPPQGNKAVREGCGNPAPPRGVVGCGVCVGRDPYGQPRVVGRWWWWWCNVTMGSGDGCAPRPVVNVVAEAARSGPASTVRRASAHRFAIGPAGAVDACETA